MVAIYGIDLGTTYSCIAKMDAQGKPHVIYNESDISDTLASALYFESLENIIIGESAKEYVETDGANVVQFIKREIGKENEFPPRILHGKRFTPVELSSLILQGIKNMAEEQGEEVKDVIITVPAYFGLEERNLTKKAGEAAGLNVLDLIDEPIAAALNYCSGSFKNNENILVYDLGGTFEVTLIKISTKQNDDGVEETQIEIVVTGGNNRLGGKDWDDALYSFIKNKVVEELGLTEDDLDTDTLQTIRSKVETAKNRLSNASKATVRINVEGLMVKIDVTKAEFEDLTRSLVDQTMSYVEGTLNKAKEKLGTEPKIDKVLLVGGSTYMPMIKNAVEAKFPGIVQQEDPDLAVAKGAAIYSSMKNVYQVSDRNLYIIAEGLDVFPRSLGLAVTFRNNLGQLEYLIDYLVKKGDLVGKKVEKNYFTFVPYQKTIVLEVYEIRSLNDIVKPYIIPGSNNTTECIQQEDGVKKLCELQLESSGKDIYVEFTVNASDIQIKATFSTDMSRSITCKYFY